MYKNFNLTDQERKEIMEQHKSHGYKKPLSEQQLQGTITATPQKPTFPKDDKMFDKFPNTPDGGKKVVDDFGGTDVIYPNGKTKSGRCWCRGKGGLVITSCEGIENHCKDATAGWLPNRINEQQAPAQNTASALSPQNGEPTAPSVTGGVEINGYVYKKPGITAQNIQQYLKVSDVLGNLQELKAKGLKSAHTMQGNHVDQMIEFWIEAKRKPEAGHVNVNASNIGPNSNMPQKRYALSLQRIVKNVLQYSAEMGVNGQQFVSNPSGYTQWAGSSMEDPSDFVKIYPNIIEVMGSIITSRESALS